MIDEFVYNLGRDGKYNERVSYGNQNCTWCIGEVLKYFPVEDYVTLSEKSFCIFNFSFSFFFDSHSFLLRKGSFSNFLVYYIRNVSVKVDFVFNNIIIAGCKKVSSNILFLLVFYFLE